MKKKLLASLLLLNASLAYSTTPNFSVPSLSFLKAEQFNFQTGVFWSSQGSYQHIDMQDLIGDDFTVAKKTDSNVLVGLSYFIEGKTFANAQIDYGVNFFYLPTTSVNGIVIQENLFPNLSYNYHIRHYPVYGSIKTKLTVANQAISLDAGIGPNFMNTSTFTEHSLDLITIPDDAFKGHSSTQFSATAGIAMALGKLLGVMPLECGYRFFYLGQGRLDANKEQVLNNLNTGSIYSNALICGVHL